jgi:hypothetical protein
MQFACGLSLALFHGKQRRNHQWLIVAENALIVTTPMMIKDMPATAGASRRWPNST